MGLTEVEARVQIVAERELREGLRGLVAASAVSLATVSELASVGIGVALRTLRAHGPPPGSTGFVRASKWFVTGGATGLTMRPVQ